MAKYYAVRKGYKTGIFNTWNECKEQTSGFSGAEFKSFKNKEEAENYLGYNNQLSSTLNNKNKDIEYNIYNYKENNNSDNFNHLDNLDSCNNNTANYPTFNNNKEHVIAYVDGSYNIKTKTYGYGVVLLFNSKKIKFSGKGNDPEQAQMRNVSGEILGAQRAIKESIKLEPKPKSITIYYDYKGIEEWATGNWKANKKHTKKYANFVNNFRDKININFIKVPAHSNIELNEEVDVLAKKAVGIV